MTPLVKLTIYLGGAAVTAIWLLIFLPRPQKEKDGKYPEGLIGCYLFVLIGAPLVWFGYVPMMLAHHLIDKFLPDRESDE